jgi:hypothetical protein
MAKKSLPEKLPNFIFRILVNNQSFPVLLKKARWSGNEAMRLYAKNPICQNNN